MNKLIEKWKLNKGLLAKKIEDIKAPEPFVSSSKLDSDFEATESNDYEVTKIEEK
jgi:hypothetical protein